MRTVILFLALTLLVSAHSPSLRPTAVCVSTEEVKLYDLLMEYRKTKQLERIPLSLKLTQVAQVHARDLSENYKPGNEKCNIHSWSKKGNWKACCYTSDHKEASCMWNKPKEISGYASNAFEIAYYSSKGASAAEGLEGWKKSIGHNQVIINEATWKNVKWNAIGIGIYKEYGVVWFGELADDSKIENCR